MKDRPWAECEALIQLTTDSGGGALTLEQTNGMTRLKGIDLKEFSRFIPFIKIKKYLLAIR